MSKQFEAFQRGIATKGEALKAAARKGALPYANELIRQGYYNEASAELLLFIANKMVETENVET